VKRWGALAAGVILMGAVGLARRRPAAEDVPRPPSVTTVALPAISPGETFVEPSDLFWEDLRERGRAEVVSRTARHLGWDEARASSLASMSEGVARALETAWAVRDGEVLALPADLDPEEREQRVLAAQLRYEESKRQTLSRLSELLDRDRHRERELLDHLEEWVDAVR
jgi:hypothetical protein